MNLNAILLLVISYIAWVVYLFTLKSGRKKISLAVFMLGYVFVLISIVSSILIYDFDTTMDLLFLNEQKRLGKFVSIGYACILSSITSLVYCFLKSRKGE